MPEACSGDVYFGNGSIDGTVERVEINAFHFARLKLGYDRCNPDGPVRVVKWNMIADYSAPPPLPAEELADCLRRVRTGDQMAARELVAQVRPVVVRIVRRRLPRREAEEDLVQEVFIKMFSRLRQYHGEAPFIHWLARIALRTCFDHLRAQRCRPELRWADLTEGRTARIEAALVDPHGRSPGDLLATREIVHLVLAGLKADDRRIVVLFHFRQMSLAEISRTTGWNMEFVKMRLFRARGKMQRLVLNLPKWDGLGCRRPRPVPSGRHEVPPGPGPRDKGKRHRTVIEAKAAA